MNNSICTLFDNILIDIHKFKSLRYDEFLLFAEWAFLLSLCRAMVIEYIQKVILTGSFNVKNL